jgi:hypothetical protein
MKLIYTLFISLIILGTTIKNVQSQDQSKIVNLRAKVQAKVDYTGHKGSAGSVIDRELRKNPKDADMHYAAGVIYAEFGMIPFSRMEYKKALKINPDYIAAKKGISNCYIKESEEEYNNFDNIEADYQRNAYHLYRKLQRAKPDYKEALKWYPENKVGIDRLQLAEKYMAKYDNRLLAEKNKKEALLTNAKTYQNGRLVKRINYNYSNEKQGCFYYTYTSTGVYATYKPESDYLNCTILKTNSLGNEKINQTCTLSKTLLRSVGLNYCSSFYNESNITIKIYDNKGSFVASFPFNRYELDLDLSLFDNKFCSIEFYQNGKKCGDGVFAWDSKLLRPIYFVNCKYNTKIRARYFKGALTVKRDFGRSEDVFADDAIVSYDKTGDGYFEREGRPGDFYDKEHMKEVEADLREDKLKLSKEEKRYAYPVREHSKTYSPTYLNDAIQNCKKRNSIPNR